MAEKSIEERISAFNEENKPFYIVDLLVGKYSLRLPIDLLPYKYYPYCQEAFNDYAVSMGWSAFHGLNEEYRAFGSGYDWQAAFQEAFKDDPNIGKILFDCESGGFFCDCNDLDIIEDFGRRFKVICEDIESFTPIVAEGIRNAELHEAEYNRLLNSVRGQLMQKPQATFDILTPYGDVRIPPDMAKKLLGGEMPIVDIAGVHYADHELLDQPITEQQTDIFDVNFIRMKTKEAPELEQEPTMMM